MEPLGSSPILANPAHENGSSLAIVSCLPLLAGFTAHPPPQLSAYPVRVLLEGFHHAITPATSENGSSFPRGVHGDDPKLLEPQRGRGPTRVSGRLEVPSTFCQYQVRLDVRRKGGHQERWSTGAWSEPSSLRLLLW